MKEKEESKLEYIDGLLVPIIMGSDTDMPWAEKIKEELDEYKIKSQYRIGSAHRTPGHVLDIVKEYNIPDEITDKILIVSVAGGTDGLSGELSAQSVACYKLSA